MCLLVGVVAKVQAPRWEMRQQLVFGSSFCGCSSSILDPPDHEDTCRKFSFATAILMVRWLEIRRATTTKRRAQNKLMAHHPARGLNLGDHTNQETHDSPWFGARGSITGPGLVTLGGAPLSQCCCRSRDFVSFLAF